MSAQARALDGRVVIVGAGVAGLMTALHLAPQPVLLVSKGQLGAESSTLWAQGGLSAAMGRDDSPELHAADTLAAGDGLCDVDVVAAFTAAAPSAIEALARLGVAFDRDARGDFALGLEGAHGRRRIVHVGGDGAGREVLRALVAAARRTPSIETLEGFEARRLLVVDNQMRGLVVVGPKGPLTLASDRVVIATGGVGGLYEFSTNPRGSFGQGLALAARAGAHMADMEFVQFHPTALDSAARPAPLISEAVRGEGAILIDETGERFMAGVAGGELASRDVVARAIWRRLSEGHRVYLDARAALGERFAARFPAIAEHCARAGIDPAREPIPTRPAAHYHMGGVAVDAEGRSSIDGLWVCGEAACTGLHGANRLASNSLSEAVVFARVVAASLARTPSTRAAPPLSPPVPPSPDASPVRAIVSGGLGVLRDAQGLRDAIAALAPLAASKSASADPAAVALMIAVAALRREDSCGAHFRTDHPVKASAPLRQRWTLNEALGLAQEVAQAIAPQPLTRRA